jgi:hypothetical protein
MKKKRLTTKDKEGERMQENVDDKETLNYDENQR